MNSKYLLIVGLCLSLLHWSCDEIEPISSEASRNNPDLVFPAANEFLISHSTDRFNFPVFHLNNLSNRIISIAVFKDEIQLNADKTEITNKEDIIWKWNDKVQNDISISYESGQDRNGEAPVPINCIFASDPDREYYWAAWVWDENGSKISKSTSIHDFKLVNANPGLKYIKSLLEFDHNFDGYINGGERIRLNVFLKNEGASDLENVQATFTNQYIQEFPTPIDYGTINEGQTSSRQIEFTTNYGYKYGSWIPITIVLTGDNCYYHELRFEIPINGRWACLEEIILDQIPPFAPNGQEWDPGGKPDFLFSMLEQGNTVPIIPFSDVHTNLDLPVSWSIPSCQGLNVSRTYSLAFREFDGFIEEPISIGTIDFRMENYMHSAEPIISIASGDLKARLVIKWE